MQHNVTFSDAHYRCGAISARSLANIPHQLRASEGDTLVVSDLSGKVLSRHVLAWAFTTLPLVDVDKPPIHKGDVIWIERGAWLQPESLVWPHIPHGQASAFFRAWHHVTENGLLVPGTSKRLSEEEVASSWKYFQSCKGTQTKAGSIWFWLGAPPNTLDLSWMYLDSSRDFRRRILNKRTVKLLLKLGLELEAASGDVAIPQLDLVHLRDTMHEIALSLEQAPASHRDYVRSWALKILGTCDHGSL